MRRALGLLVLFCLGAPLKAEYTGGSSASALSFALPRGARPVSLGGAYLAVASGSDSMLWNPAGLNQLRRGEVTMGHNAYLDGVADDYLAVGFPIYGLGAWGLSLYYLNASDEAYDNWGNPDRSGTWGNPDSSNIFRISDFSGQVAFSYEGPDDLHAGLVYKILDQVYAGQHSMGSAFDFAFQYRNIYKLVDLGGGIFNTGTPISLGGGSALPPLAFKAGAALRPMDGLLFASDFEFLPMDHFSKWHFGAEYSRTFEPVVALVRTGYVLGPEQSQGAMAGWAFGFGVNWAAWTLDYALAPFGDLGNSHRVSLTWAAR